MNCSLPHLGVRLPLPWWPVLLCIGASCVDVTPPWQQSGRRDASDVSAVWLPDTGVEDTGGTPGGMAGIGGTGGLALDGRGGSGGVEGEVGLPSTDGEVDVSVGDAPVVLDAGQTGSVDARSAGDVGLDGFGDLPLGGGGAGGSGGDARRDAGSGGQAGSGGAIDRGGTGGRGGVSTSGGATGSGGATAGETGGSGTGGATVSVCAAYQGADGGVEPGVDGGLPQGLVAYYPCDQASGVTLPDLSGKGRNATLSGSVSGTGGTTGTPGYSFARGQIGDALFLTKASMGYAALPAGILAGACEMTVATWVYVNTQVAWQRVWDFGRDSNLYMFLTPSSGATDSALRFGIAIDGSASEQTIDGQAPLPVGQWQHVAVVLGPAGAVLYVNGSPVGANLSITLRPADLGSTTNNFIGRSQFVWDPYFDGAIDDFRVYNRALSASEITTLYAYTGS